MFTTEPAVQLYTANFLDGTLKGKAGSSTRSTRRFASRPSIFPIRSTSPSFRRPSCDPARRIPRRRFTSSVPATDEQRSPRCATSEAAAAFRSRISRGGSVFPLPTLMGGSGVRVPMKAVAVLPGKPNSVHLREIPVPKLTDQPHPHVCRIPEGRACW